MIYFVSTRSRLKMFASVNTTRIGERAVESFIHTTMRLCHNVIAREKDDRSRIIKHWKCMYWDSIWQKSVGGWDLSGQKVHRMLHSWKVDSGTITVTIPQNTNISIRSSYSWLCYSLSLNRPCTRCRCATKTQDASGWKIRPGNCRFIPVATQKVGWRDPPAEALGTNVSLLALQQPGRP